VDSPLTAEVTEIFRRHPECYDEEMRQIFLRGEDPFRFRRLRYVRSTEESKSLNHMPGPFVVLSASGMCESGRILHHLIHGLSDARNTILFVGFQAQGTLGRRIVEGAKKVKILEGEYPVRARIEMMHNFSAHADRRDLLEYVAACAKGSKGIFLVHGESDQSQELARGLRDMGLGPIHLPQKGDCFPIGGTV
jgi:metallo-beta-lactamase family protein